MAKGNMGGKRARGGIPKSIIEGHSGLRKDAFFGMIEKVSNQYILFDQVTDRNSAIIMTNNIDVVKGRLWSHLKEGDNL